MVVSVIMTLIIFTVVVVVHEWGHMMAAKKSGILVEEFAVGMGPKLFGIKRGETEYTLRLLPLGGSCRMLGEDSDDYNPRSFNAQPVWKRIIVITAGVIMNMVLAFVVSIISAALSNFYVPEISSVIEGMPAAEAGLQAGDKIVRVNGSKVNIYYDFYLEMIDSDGSAIDLEILRDGQTYSYSITPDFSEGYKLGFYPSMRLSMISGAEDAAYPKATLVETISYGYHYVFYNVKSVYSGLVGLVSGRLSMNDMAGPIGFVSVVDDAYEDISANATTPSAAAYSMLVTILNFTTLLSANLAVMNILPIPALDGGRLVFLIIEGIRRKPINPEREGLIHLAGFVLLMVFAVFVAYNDVIKLF